MYKLLKKAVWAIAQVIVLMAASMGFAAIWLVVGKYVVPLLDAYL